MLLYTLRLLHRHPQRLLLTVLAVALCSVMMLFLLATYRGVADGSVEYVRRNACDLWVLQRNSTNLLRGTSFLTAADGRALRSCAGVKEAHPVLLILPTLRHGTKEATVFLAGYDALGDARRARGAPPVVIRGRNLRGDGDIVLDRAFSAKLGIGVGEVVTLNGDSLTVCGLSEGTNAFVVQYAFVTLTRAQRIAGIPELVSLYLLSVVPGEDPATVAGRIEAQVDGVHAYTHDEFLANNLREMETGFLPILYAVAGIGVVVMTSILSLLLGITILERRRDFAVMKTLGAPRGYLPACVAVYALTLAALGFAAGMLLFPLLESSVSRFAPEIGTAQTAGHVLLVAAVCVAVSQASALLSMRRLRGIYALEVFQ